MLGLVFFGSLAVFVLIVLFLYWYYKTIVHVVVDKMRNAVDAVVSDGVTPAKWQARLDKLRRALERPVSPERKAKLVEHYVRYVEASTKDMCAYAQKTIFLPDEDSKNDAVERLERFCEETVKTVRNL